MGAKTQILLVTALPIGQAQATNIITAHEHPAFWPQSGVRASDELKDAQTVYLRQDEILVRSGNVMFQHLGLPISHLSSPSIWLTVRFTILNVPEEIPTRIIRSMQHRQTAGNHVISLQVDLGTAIH